MAEGCSRRSAMQCKPPFPRHRMPLPPRSMPSKPCGTNRSHMHRHLMWSGVVLALVGLAGLGGDMQGTAAQDATPAPATRPLVGTWVVDTISASENDSPEIAVVTPDGGVIGLGANRVAGGRWQAIDEQAAELTLVSVFEKEGVGRYVIVRGPHTVDETGDAWTCECTVTVVS